MYAKPYREGSLQSPKGLRTHLHTFRFFFPTDTGVLYNGGFVKLLYRRGLTYKRWVLSGSCDLTDIYDTKIFTRSVPVRKLQTEDCPGSYTNIDR